MIIDTVLAELKRVQPGLKRLDKVRLVAGKYHQVSHENLVFMYEILTQNTPAEGSILEIKSVPIMARCVSCQWNGAIHDACYLCGACGSGDLEITSGKELYLDGLEVELDD